MVSPSVARNKTSTGLQASLRLAGTYSIPSQRGQTMTALLIDSVAVFLVPTLVTSVSEETVEQTRLQYQH